MKKNLALKINSRCGTSLLLLVSLVIGNGYSLFAQGVTTYLVPLNSNYTVSVPPKEAVVYDFVSTAPFTAGCTFNWEVTNGWLDFVGGNTQNQSFSNLRPIYFNNVNGSGTVKVTVSACTSVTNTDGSVTDGTPNNGKSATLSVQIRYLGPVGDIKVDGNTVSGSTAVSCGTHTASVDPVQNANYYVWELPSGWSGSSSTNTITFSTNASTASGTIKVTAFRNDAPNFADQNKSISISLNNLPGVPSVSASGVPDLYICSGETITVTANGDNASNYNWSTSGTLLVNGGTSASGSTVTITGTGSYGYGTFSVKTYSSSCNFESAATTSTYYAGTPTVGAVTADGVPFSGGMCNGYGLNLYFSIQGASSSSGFSITSGNGSNAYLTDYGGGSVRFNSYVNDCYGIDSQQSNRCGTAGVGTTVCVENCGGRIAVSQNQINAYPNPAKNVLTVELLNVDDSNLDRDFQPANISGAIEGRISKVATSKVSSVLTSKSLNPGLPQRIDLISEKEGLVFSFDFQNIQQRKLMKEGKKIEIDISKFPRGIYYLHIINGDSSATSKMEKIRVLLN